MKWLFALMTLIIEALSAHLFENSFWGVLLTFMLPVISAILLKITDEKKSAIQFKLHSDYS